ncbi:MAG: hypothetical protein A2Z88_03870 [Omnitrophica WOR_2 bacterium GWA2_47_8]|nr:MAG: hypothetical protein A2Z88_03870 [Omnitrophica WOR_2 bacterium GWA2_47_8]
MSIVSVLSLLTVLSLNSPAAENNENPFSAKLSVRYSPEVDIKDQSGELQYAKIVLRLGYQKILENGTPVYINIGPDHYILTENSAVNLPPDAKSRGIRVGTELNVPFVDDHFLLGLELNPTFQTAKEVQFDSDGFRMRFSTFLKYKADNGLVWVLGANVRPGYEMPVLPIFGFNYQLNDKISINLVSDAPNVSYALTDKTKLLWEFDYTFDEFEIIGGSLDGSTLSIQDFATGAGIEHTFNDHVAVKAGFGGVFNRIIKYEDAPGKVVPENGVYFSVKADVHF